MSADDARIRPRRAAAARRAAAPRRRASRCGWAARSAPLARAARRSRSACCCGRCTRRAAARGCSAWSPRLTVIDAEGLADRRLRRDAGRHHAFPACGVLRLDAPRWQALAAGARHRRALAAPGDRHAPRRPRRAGLPRRGRAAERTPATPPQSLRLPVEIEVRAASVDELRIGGGDATPVRDAARSRPPRRRRRRAPSLRRARRRPSSAATRRGACAIGADAPFAVDASVDATAADAATALAARAARASGPLEALAPSRHGARRAPATATPAQSLDARALDPPVRRLAARRAARVGEALDLSAFASALPATALSGARDATTSGIDRAGDGLARRSPTRAPAAGTKGLLPVRRLRAELRARPDDPERDRGAGAVAPSSARRQRGARQHRRPGPLGAPSAGTSTLELAPASGRRRSTRARAVASGSARRAPARRQSAAASPRVGGAPSARRRGRRCVADLAGQLADRRLPRAAPQTRAGSPRGERERERRSSCAAPRRRSATPRATLDGRLARSERERAVARHGQARAGRLRPGAVVAGRRRFAARAAARIASTRRASSISLLAADERRRGATPRSRRRAARRRWRSPTACSPASPLAGRRRATSTATAAPDRRSTLRRRRQPRPRRRDASAGARRSDDDWQRRASTRLALDRARAAARSACASGGGDAPRPRWPAALDGERPHRRSLARRCSSDGELRGNGACACGRSRCGAAQRSLAPRQRRRRAARRPRSRSTASTLAGPGDRSHAGPSVTGTARAHRAELRVESALLPPAWTDAIAQRSAPTAAPPAASSPRRRGTVARRRLPAPRATASRAASSSLRSKAAWSMSTASRAGGWRGTRARAARAARRDAGHAPGCARATCAAASSGPAAPPRVSARAGQRRSARRHAALEPGRLAGEATRRRAARGSMPQAEVDAVADRADAARAAARLRLGRRPRASARTSKARSAPASASTWWSSAPSGDLTRHRRDRTQRARPHRPAPRHRRRRRRLELHRRRSPARRSASSRRAVDARTSPERDLARRRRRRSRASLELRVANLGTWGPWVPPGWRLGGALHASASFGGRFGAPEYTGHVEGDGSRCATSSQGVNVTRRHRRDRACRARSARIETLHRQGRRRHAEARRRRALRRGADGAAHARADRFELLGRVDRRIVASGTRGAAARRDDARRSTAASRSTKVSSTSRRSRCADARRRRRGRAPTAARRRRAAALAQAQAPRDAAVPARRRAREVALDLRVDMGEQAARARPRPRCRAARRAAPHLAERPAGRQRQRCARSTAPTRRTARSSTSTAACSPSSAPVENPRLDIEATRPNLDVRVGVAVTGTALNPRVRLFSEPEHVGHRQAELARRSAAPARRPAAPTPRCCSRPRSALLSGEGPGATDQLIAVDRPRRDLGAAADRGRPPRTRSSASASRSRSAGTSATSAASTPPPAAGS